MNELAKLFEHQGYDMERMMELDSIADPRRCYIIAMTPRSGSSYLCDVLTGTRRLGVPGEILNQQFIPKIIEKIPGRTPGEYLLHVSRVRKTRNGIYGFKASWFQFNNFVRLLDIQSCLAGYKYIYLTRRNVALQAVSLYKATASSVFHTNIAHDEDAVKKLESLEYDYEEIDKWYRHIVAQEEGWQEYFRSNRIFPCCITYEEIDQDIHHVVEKIALYLGVNPDKVSLSAKPSVFSKVSDPRNLEWACRFQIERNQKMGEC